MQEIRNKSARKFCGAFCFVSGLYVSNRFCKNTPVKISACIIALNEEENITKALESLDWADEIVVVDSGSADRTAELAEGLGARLFTQEWLGFSKQKQFAVECCTYDWIFSLDADEIVSDALKDSILALKASSTIADGYRISRLTYYMNRPIRHGGWYPDWQLRLFDRSRGKWSDSLIHESVQMAADASVKKLNADILHFTVKDAAHHHQMIGERYAPLAAEQMFRNGRRTSPVKIAVAGLTTFLQTYFLKAGFLDGLPGFCIAKFAAHHAFLKHLILWEKQSDQDS